jgi:hypothetical protein
MSDRKGKEELPENEQPVNRLSKQAIKKLGETPDPGRLYFLQLVHLCLDKGVLRLLNGMKAPFLDLLDTLDLMSPKRLQDFLGRAEDEEGPEVVMSPDPNWNPAELAEVIIITLGIVAGERFDDYPFPTARD